MHTDRVNFLDLGFDQLSFKDVKSRLKATTSQTPFGYIVTPNVDHVVRVHREPDLRRLYDAADLCVCDSRILRLLAWIRGIKLSLVAGSDLCATLFSEIVEPNDRIAIVGADRFSVETLRAQFPQTEFLHFEPPMGLRTNLEARRSAAAFIASSNARFCFIAVGSPQQELVANQVQGFPGARGMGLCIGAGLDFIVGKQQRAPRLLQRLGLEWAHRLVTNPRRLWRRYLVDGVRIFPIWLRWKSPGRGRIWILPILSIAIILAAGAAMLATAPSRSNRISSSYVSKLPPLSSQSIAAINALPPPNLLKPLSQEQAAQVNAQRPFAERSDSAASRFFLRTDADDQNRALTCLAQAVYYEAAGEGMDGGRAVAQVVLNRVRHPGFPSTICGVVYEGSERSTGCQFSFTCDGSMQRIPVPWLWSRSQQIAKDALRGKVFSEVGHATHYHADYVIPYWADALDKSVQVGKHIFYRLRNTLGDARAFSQHYGGTEPPYKVPGATIVIPTTTETQQLTTALSGEGQTGLSIGVEKASPQPSPTLLADSERSSLLADGGSEVRQPRRQKSSHDCEITADRKEISALHADEMRAGAQGAIC